MTTKAGVGALGAVLLAVLIFLAISSWSRQPAAAARPSVQPINFPHNTHVQTYKIDCQYCHADARRSEYAGLPSVQRCLGCHKIVAADKPDIKKLTEYGTRAEPIPWARVYDGTRLVGTTPLANQALAAGPHKLAFVTEDGKRVEKQIDIASGEVTKMQLDLK